MLIGNLPIAGNAPTATHNENRQRVNQFRSLENALLDGDVSGSKESTELLRLNAPNAAQSAQMLRQFGHDNQAEQQFEVLENASEGNLLGSQAVSSIAQRDEHAKRQRDGQFESGPGSSFDEDTLSSDAASANRSLGGTLDTLA